MKNYSIANESLHLTVSELGAELQSITAKKDNKQYLWHGDPAIWSGRAPILFPIVGALKGATTKHNGQTLHLPRHGLARHSRFSLTKSTQHSLHFTLHSSADSLAVFPWEFSLSVTYTLQDNQIKIEYEVCALDDKPLLFTIGSHPAFSLNTSDYPLNTFSIRFSQNETLKRYRLNSEGLLSNNSEKFALHNQSIKLSDTLFNDDALVFKDIKSTYISLYHQHQECVRVHTGGAPHLGIWAKPGSPFVCIEPWFGHSDSETATDQWSDKPSLLTLNKGETFTNQWAIEIPGSLR